METDSNNDNVEKHREIKSIEEFSMMGANEDSELIVPKQVDDYGNIQCQNCDQISEKCNKCFFKSVIHEIIDNMELQKDSVNFQNLSKTHKISNENLQTSTHNENFPKFKCCRCNVVSNREDRFKRHDELSKGIKTIKTCKNGCGFKSCTLIGYRNHQCLNSDGKNHETQVIESQLEPEIPLEKTYQPFEETQNTKLKDGSKIQGLGRKGLKKSISQGLDDKLPSQHEILSNINQNTLVATNVSDQEKIDPKESKTNQSMEGNASE